MTQALIAAAVGFGTGIVSAFGIGGGTLLLLVMTLFLGVEGPVARCINLLYFLPTALGSLYYHKKNGYLKRSHPQRYSSGRSAGSSRRRGSRLRGHAAAAQKPFGLYLLWAGVSVLWPKKKK